MTCHGSAFRLEKVALPPTVWGLLGVLAFSGTLPATRVALPAFGPVTVGLGRAVVAALLAAAMLPVATAVVAVVRVGERAGWMFWAASLAGTGTVVAFALVAGAGSLRPADLLLLAAVVAAAVGYAEGAILARAMPGWQVICWALLASAPVLVPVCAVALAVRPPHSAGLSAWVGFGYVAVVSMFLGFFAWYHGLARGGVARVGQLQLAQPVLTLLWAAVLLGEHIGAAAALTALGVLACTVVTQRSGPHRSTSHLTEAVSR